MSNKYSKDKTLQSMKAKKDEHISGIAGAIFAVFMVACVLGAIIMSENNTSDTTIGIYVTVTMLIGIYILFALKVASQWEKAVVLRLGRFQRIGRTRSILDHPDCRYYSNLDRSPRHGHALFC